MWECNVCLSWQHAACAGDGADEPPPDYACYACRAQAEEA